MNLVFRHCLLAAMLLFFGCGGEGANDIDGSEADASILLDAEAESDSNDGGTEEQELACRTEAFGQQTGRGDDNVSGRYFDEIDLSVHARTPVDRPVDSETIQFFFDQLEPDIGPPLMRFEPDAIRALLAWDSRGCIDVETLVWRTPPPPSSTTLQGFVTELGGDFGVLVEFDYLGATHRVAVEKRCCLDDGVVGGS